MRQIIILDTRRFTNGAAPDDIQLRAAFWFPVPAGSESPLGAAVDVTKVPGATQAEITALQEGRLIEYIYTIMFPLTATGAQVKSTLVAAYNATVLPDSPRPNPTKFNGASYENGVWTL